MGWNRGVKSKFKMAANSEEKYVSLVRNPSFLFFLAEQKAYWSDRYITLCL